MAYTTPEQSVQQKIISYLNKLEEKGYPLEHHRREATGANYRKGSSDLFFFWGPFHVEVEIKAPNGKLSTMQEKWKERMDKHGTPCWVIDNIEIFKQLMQENFLNKKD